MKTLLTMGAAVVCSLGVLLLVPGHESDWTFQVVKAAVDARSVIPTHSAKSKKANTLPALSVKLEADEIIELPVSEGAYVGKFTLGHKDNTYFISVSDLPERPNTRLMRANVRTRESEEIRISGIGDGSLIDISLDSDGLLYGTVHWASRVGGIIVLTPTGDLISRIETSRFLPSKITVDSAKRIWVVGQQFDSSGVSLIDVQVRVYNSDGELISAPLGGLHPDDCGLSVFSVDDGDAKLISSLGSLVYDFSGTDCVGAHYYSFDSSPGSLNGGVQATASSSGRLVYGVSRVKNTKVWYGGIGDEKTPGAYTRSFIGLTRASGEPVTTEISLPSQYRSLVLVDDEGYLYALGKESSQLVLRKTRIEIRKANGSKMLFQSLKE